MIDKINKIKKSRLNKDDLNLFNILEKLNIKKYKNNYFLIFNFDIYCEIDMNNTIIWIDNELFNFNNKDFSNWIKIRRGIKEYFNIEIDYFVMYSFPVRYNKKVFYFGKPRKKNFLYHFICFLNRNRLSL